LRTKAENAKARDHLPLCYWHVINFLPQAEYPGLWDSCRLSIPPGHPKPWRRAKPSQGGNRETGAKIVQTHSAWVASDPDLVWHCPSAPVFISRPQSPRFGSPTRQKMIIGSTSPPIPSRPCGLTSPSRCGSMAPTSGRNANAWGASGSEPHGATCPFPADLEAVDTSRPSIGAIS
jgi:hypothetical protein